MLFHFFQYEHLSTFTPDDIPTVPIAKIKDRIITECSVSALRFGFRIEKWVANVQRLIESAKNIATKICKKA